MIKINILIQCDHCQGAAYLPIREAVCCNGERYIQHAPCPDCNGSGKQMKWVSLKELVPLLEDARCRHKHTSFHGGLHYIDGDVWDDVVEVCDDCGENLDASSGFLDKESLDEADLP
jgi:hypothetical protein